METTYAFTTGESNNTDTPHLVNNILRSFFTDSTVSADGIKISATNGHYAHKSFNEIEFLMDRMQKNWLKCQGYENEADSTRVPAARFTA